MIARISKGSSVSGMVFYNHNKTKEELSIDENGKTIMSGSLLDTSNIFISEVTPKPHKRIIDTINVYNNNNPNRSEPNMHISINFHKDDILTDQNMVLIANDYLTEMKLQDQPFAIYRHFDKQHPHIHVVTTRIDNKGSFISDSNEQYKSVAATEKIEHKYGLTIAKDSTAKTVQNLEKEINQYYSNNASLFPIINSAMKVVLENNPTSYKELDKGLLEYNIVRREVPHNDKKGHCFYLLKPEEIPKFEENKTYHIEGKYAKGSDLDNDYNFQFIQQLLRRNKENKEKNLKSTMGKFYSVLKAITSPVQLSEFKTQLQKKGLKLTVFRKETGDNIGKIYGASIINSESKSTYKLSELKESWSKIAPLIIDNPNAIKKEVPNASKEINSSESSKTPNLPNSDTNSETKSDNKNELNINETSFKNSLSKLDSSDDELGITDSIAKKKKRRKKR